MLDRPVDQRPPVFHSGFVSETPKPVSHGQVVALTRYRAQLERGRRSRRADSLFATADPVGAIRALPPDEFFYVLHELGFPEALEILVHGTAEQVQGALDLALWDRDQISTERADEWLAAIAQAPFETVGAWARSLDIELVALLIRQRARIYDLSLEEPPDEPEGVLFDTPDRLFTLELLGDEQTQRMTQQLMENLYRADQFMMRRFLVGMRSELDSELEQTAFRWRSGRMADLGFVDFYEALEVYRELDPASVQLESGPVALGQPPDELGMDTHLRLPVLMAARLAGATPFARAVAGLTSAAEVTARRRPSRGRRAWARGSHPGPGCGVSQPRRRGCRPDRCTSRVRDQALPAGRQSGGQAAQTRPVAGARQPLCRTSASHRHVGARGLRGHRRPDQVASALPLPARPPA